jgi:HSP20 family protein
VAWIPNLDVFEKDNRLIARVDLPGMKREDIKVEVNEGYLAISGERKKEVEEKKENLYRCEREYGTFHRAFALPEGTRADAVKATFENGVLEVSVPLAARVESKAQTVRIEAPGKAAPKAA